MHVAKAAIKEIFHEPTDVFWTGRAMDVLFNGILIDCDVTNSLAKIACKEIRKRNDPTFKSLDNGKLLFSMFAGVRIFLILIVICITILNMLKKCNVSFFCLAKQHLEWSLEDLSRH